MQRRLASKLILIVSIPLVAQIGLLAALSAFQVKAAGYAEALEAQRGKNAALLGLQDELFRLWMSNKTGKAPGMEQIEESIDTYRRVQQRMDEIEGFYKNDPDSRKIIRDFEAQMKRQAQMIAEEPEAVMMGAPRKWIEPVKSLKGNYNHIRELMTQGVAESTRLANEIQKLNDISSLVLGIGIIVEFFLIGLSVFWFNRGIAGRFSNLSQTITNVALNRPLNPPIKGKDELAYIDDIFRKMAGELAESEIIQDAIMENARDVIFSLDEKLSFTEVNAASSVVFGYSPEELTSMRVANLVKEEDLSRALAQLENAKKRSIEPFEVRIKRADRVIVDTLWSVTWSRTGKTFFCVAHDNTSRKEAERLRSELTQLISEDLRSPLALMNSCFNDLGTGKLGTLSPQGVKFRGNASNATSQMLTLVNDLLDIENFESGALSLKLKLVALESIFEQAVQQASGLSQKYKVNVEADSTEIAIVADKDRLIQVLTNLLSNAVKFSPPESTVRLTATEDAEFIEIQVIDQGRGIPEAIIPFIFDRFRQVEMSDAKAKGGSGLGLAICKALVELHKGTITVTSKTDEGTTFTVRIPGLSAHLEAGVPE